MDKKLQRQLEELDDEHRFSKKSLKIKLKPLSKKNPKHAAPWTHSMNDTNTICKN
jgi:hypothetical protein